MSKSASSGGIGFCGLLTILFIGLKLTGHIAWSWVWVLAPLWIPALLAASILGGTVVIVCIVQWWAHVKRKQKDEDNN